MTVVQISDLQNHEHESVVLQGWIAGQRSGGKIQFLLVRDGTGTCQCIVEAKDVEAFDTARRATLECSVCVAGAVRLDERAPGGAELLVQSIHIIGGSEEYPITRKAHGTDFLMQHRHLWLRSSRQTTILRIRDTLIHAVRMFFHDREFTLIDTPILSPGAAEGAGTLFELDYFGDPVYLAQTGQLYLESACMALGKVYCFGPTFRAEKSKTRRHLTEFWMVEPEIAFAELDDLCTLTEEFLIHITKAVLQKHTEDLHRLGRNTAPLQAIQGSFPRMTYSDAVDMLHSTELQEKALQRLEEDKIRLKDDLQLLQEKQAQREATIKRWKQEKLDAEIEELQHDIQTREKEIALRPHRLQEAAHFTWGNDLGADEETLLSQQFEQPLIVTHYPKEAKAFYMKEDAADPRCVLNLDVLAPEGYGEIIGGSQREDNLGCLTRRMKEEKMEPAAYEWYLDLRRYGSVPHGGFGLGIERTLAWICGLPHIRETIPFPRLMGRMYP